MDKDLSFNSFYFIADLLLLSLLGCLLVSFLLFILCNMIIHYSIVVSFLFMNHSLLFLLISLLLSSFLSLYSLFIGFRSFFCLFMNDFYYYYQSYYWYQCCFIVMLFTLCLYSNSYSFKGPFQLLERLY